jgi:hypothetical protein
MAQQGMFGNQYEQAVTAEALAREEAANTQGMTGWQAITQGMSTMGSNLGYAAGSAFGGRTDAEVKQDNYQSILNSVPNFDPSSAESMNEMASAMWNGGEYDQGMQFYDRGQKMIVDNLNVESAKLQLKELKAPKDRGTIELADGRKYYKDTLELVKSDLVVPEKPPKDKTAAMLKYERNQEASKYRNTVLKDLPSNTLEEKRVLLTALDDAGYRDSAVFTGLQSTVTSVSNTERLVSKDVQTDAEQQAKIAADARLREMGNVMPTGEGNNIVGGVFLRDKPDAGSDIKALALQNEIGGILQSYDRRLSKREDSKVTPAEAYPYYTRVFNLPEVYQGKSGMTWGGVEFNADALQQTLDAIFGVSGAAIPNDRLIEFGQQRLLIDGVSNYLDVNGQSQVYKFKQ